MNRFKLLLSFIKGSRLLYLMAVLCCIISVWVPLYVPLLGKVIIDSVIGGESINETGIMSFLLTFTTGETLKDTFILAGLGVVLTLIAGLFQFIYGSIVQVVSQRAGKQLRDKLYSHIQRQDYEYHAKVETGDLIQRCTTDVENVMMFLHSHLINIIRVIFLLVTTILIMMSINVVMSLFSLVLLPVMFLYSLHFFKRVQKIFASQEETDAALNAVLQENLTGIRVVKAFARQDYEVNKFEKANSENRERIMDIIVAMSKFWSLSDGLTILQVALVVIAGTYLAVTGNFGFGVVLAFFQFVMRVSWPVKQLGRLLGETGKTSVALKRIKEILDNKPEILEEKKATPEVRGSLEFKDVSFSYPNGTEVLKNISFKIDAGDTAAIIGPTGSGKTTLVNLVQRLYDNYEGTILLDGTDIKEIDKKFLRKRVSLILQEPFLFNKTVKENVVFAREEFEEHEVYRATETSCVHNSIENFDKGYETLVGEGGVTLSGGQKQRLAIARTLIQENPVVIFDDSLSAVDTETDRVIRDNLKKGGVKPTSIIISHRVSTIREADLIIVLEKGVITAQGKHDEIKDQDNLYRRILDIQSEIEEEFHTTIA